MSDWKQVGENLVRHRGGTIYLRASVAGKIKRISLRTDDLRIAKLKRDDLLDSMRKNASAAAGELEKIRTIGDALRLVRARVTAAPHLAGRSVAYYEEIGKTLEETLPVAMHGRTWTKEDAAAWWKKITRRFSAQRSNNMLGMAKRVGRALVDSGLRVDDPTSALRRIRIPARDLALPSKETIDAIVEDIRRQGKAFSDQSSDFVAFLAFSGCRYSQAKALRWKDVGEDWITFQGGVEGSKGAKTRRLPINAPLREVLDRRRAAGDEVGPVFTMDRPREALRNACDRLGIAPLRLHDLRHFFASWSIESGVDVPTVSRWLGHKDGGTLALRVYGHLRDDHSAEAAKRLR